MKNKSNFILSVLIILLSVHFSAQSQAPSYLKKYKEQYNQDARAANLQWFKDARFGMFIHYGLYSQLGKGEWVQLQDTIPLNEYAKLKDNFTASGFDADFIVQLAKKAGIWFDPIMGYYANLDVFPIEKNLYINPQPVSSCPDFI